MQKDFFPTILIGHPWQQPVFGPQVCHIGPNWDEINSYKVHKNMHNISVSGLSRNLVYHGGIIKISIPRLTWAGQPRQLLVFQPYIGHPNSDLGDLNLYET